MPATWKVLSALSVVVLVVTVAYWITGSDLSPLAGVYVVLLAGALYVGYRFGRRLRGG